MSGLPTNYYGIVARFQAIGHKILHPSHRVKWRVNIDEFCPGDIECITCQTVYWCRARDKIINKMGDEEMTGFRQSYGVESDPGSVRKILSEQDKDNIIESVRRGG